MLKTTITTFQAKRLDILKENGETDASLMFWSLRGSDGLARKRSLDEVTEKSFVFLLSFQS